MLLPDNIHPNQTVYYNGAHVLNIIQQSNPIRPLDLYIETKTSHDISMSLFILCLDWLFILNAIKVGEQGRIELCI
ncbi:hypothetical protein DNK10_23900 [Pseudomonas daroniae]|nr:hypothetical protein DNK10_23900 [Pseudomonas daroniae]